MLLPSLLFRSVHGGKNIPHKRERRAARINTAYVAQGVGRKQVFFCVCVCVFSSFLIVFLCFTSFFSFLLLFTRTAYSSRQNFMSINLASSHTTTCNTSPRSSRQAFAVAKMNPSINPLLPPLLLLSILVASSSTLAYAPGGSGSHRRRSRSCAAPIPRRPPSPPPPPPCCCCCCC